MGPLRQGDPEYSRAVSKESLKLYRPDEIFSGRLLLAVPHMDDEVLACGGTLAGFSGKADLKVVFATNGQRSPLPPGAPPDEELGPIRKREAVRALGILGIDEGTIHFLDLPDGELARHADRLENIFKSLLQEHSPGKILLPFRFDRHPDHLALHRAVERAARQVCPRAERYEYFVYYRYRLLAGGDLRAYLRAEQCRAVDIQPWSALKTRAILAYTSQTTCFRPWQKRAVIPPQRVEELSRGPEYFIRFDPAFTGTQVFSRSAGWIRLVHGLEPRLKELKETLGFKLRGGLDG